MHRDFLIRAYHNLSLEQRANLRKLLHTVYEYLLSEQRESCRQRVSSMDFNGSSLQTKIRHYKHLTKKKNKVIHFIRKLNLIADMNDERTNLHK